METRGCWGCQRAKFRVLQRQVPLASLLHPCPEPWCKVSRGPWRGEEHPWDEGMVPKSLRGSLAGCWAFPSWWLSPSSRVQEVKNVELGSWGWLRAMGSTSDAVGCDEILLLGLERQSRGVIASPRRGPARKCCAVSKPRRQGQDETQLGVLRAPSVAVRISFLGQGFAARGSARAQGLGFLPAFAPAGCSEPRASGCLVL